MLGQLTETCTMTRDTKTVRKRKRHLRAFSLRDFCRLHIGGFLRISVKEITFQINHFRAGNLSL